MEHKNLSVLSEFTEKLWGIYKIWEFIFTGDADTNIFLAKSRRHH